MNSCPKRKTRKHPENRQDKKENNGCSTYAGAVTGGAVTGGAVAVNTASGGTKLVNSQVLEEEMLEAPMVPTAPDASEDETSGEKNRNHPENHPWYQLAVKGLTELKNRMEEQNKLTQKELRKQAKQEEEEAKMKSPPRKKKNFSLYRK